MKVLQDTLQGNYLILTYFGNKKDLENKKNAPAGTIKFSKKDDKLMIF